MNLSDCSFLEEKDYLWLKNEQMFLSLSLLQVFFRSFLQSCNIFWHDEGGNVLPFADFVAGIKDHDVAWSLVSRRSLIINIGKIKFLKTVFTKCPQRQVSEPCTSSLAALAWVAGKRVEKIAIHGKNATKSENAGSRVFEQLMWNS